jgi:N-acetylglutamate synthase
MEITRNDRVRMERAHVLAWPALRTAEIEGWLWRSSGGGSQRANSVSTIDFTGNDVEAAVREVEGRYREQGAPARFQTFEETSPVGLDDLLRAHGYRQSDPTWTMFKRIKPARPDERVEVSNSPSTAWRDIYVGGITENRRMVNRLILERIPLPRGFFGCRIGEDIIATALGVVGFGCAVVECVTTRADMRRRGAAQTVLAALETWAAGQDADWIGLQVAIHNVPPVALYRSLGFVAGATNRFWVG